MLAQRALGNAQIAAIGPATVEALNNRGLRPDFVPDSSISENVAEGLLERGVAHKKILIARALEGREVLHEKLVEAGANVVVAPCYRTVPNHAQAELAKHALEAGQVDWVTFTSSSTVQNFVDAVGAKLIARTRPNFRVACIGPITAKTAEKFGLAPDAVAENASVEALVEVLLKERG